MPGACLMRRCCVGGAELGSPRRRDDNPNHSGLRGHAGGRLPGRGRRRRHPGDSAWSHSHDGSEQVSCAIPNQ